MRPSYGSMRDIEERTTMTVPELLDLVLAQRLKMYEAVLIVWYACESAGEGFSGVDALGDALFEERLTSLPLRTSLCKFLLACSYAPPEAKKKFDEEVAPMLGLFDQPTTG
ncbi:hypothetical protein [uncultured Tateyamaria sp.]|uniref:hypothetical protein n=1 Tax=Tateyamaria sp. 1078 TaxID=3417464 RepID=UPI002616AB00|nr:hypothetical protein [uncultured Tateyamaria sp.]